jgi:hypothetical protein
LIIPRFHPLIQCRRWLPTAVLLAVIPAALGCSLAGPLNEKAFVGPEKLRLRSSTAQAARATDELKGADPVTITDRVEAEDGVIWVEVRGPGDEKGWAEARFFVRAELVEAARRIVDQHRNIQTQALGRSRAPLKLRLTPDRTSEENVANLLPAGALLEIIGRERRPRPASKEPIAGELEGESVESAGNESRSDDWLLVRVRDFSVVPAGWIYGGSVGIEVPPEIIYFVSDGRRITGWQKIGTVTEEDGRTADNYLVLEERTNGAKPEFDFDRVKVLAYDPATRNYNTPFREDLSGRYPLTLNMNGSRGTFELKAADKTGQIRQLSYQIEMLEASRIRVTRISK